MNTEVIIFLTISAILGIILSFAAILQRRRYLMMMNSSDRLSTFERWENARSPGISKDVREKLSRFFYDPHTIDLEETQCTICLIDYNPDSELCRLNCEHIFHYMCLDKWLSQHKSCPVCRVHVIHMPDASNSKENSILEVRVDSETNPTIAGLEIPVQSNGESSNDRPDSDELLNLKVSDFMNKRAELLKHGHLNALK